MKRLKEFEEKTIQKNKEAYEAKRQPTNQFH